MSIILEDQIYNMAKEPKENKLDLGASKKSTTGAHGGGNKYHQHEVKYPKFVLGQGFKQKSKPGDSTKNDMP